MARKPNATPNVDTRLLSLIERIERLEEERKALAEDVKDIFQEAKSAGYDAKTMKRMIRERGMTREAREEQQALDEIYRAALGMLDGTPLGDAARRRLAPPAEPPGDDVEASPADGGGDVAGAAVADPDDTPEARLGANAEGAAAAKSGSAVTENPYPAGSKLRSAWDEGWCAASGSDGMDIPAAWRRVKPKKDDKGASK